MANIGFYGSHNGAIAVEQDGKIITVIEAERFIGTKNVGFAQYKIPKHKSTHDLIELVENVLTFIKNEYGIAEYETCAYGNTSVVINNQVLNLHEVIPAKNKIAYHHHYSHAMGAFAQSPYPEALVFSFDGGGDDGKFNIYHCVRGEPGRLLHRVPCPRIEDGVAGFWTDSTGVTRPNWADYDLGFPYMLVAHYLNDIKLEQLSDGNLVYSGKLMGLVSYGTVRDEWLPAFMEYYKSNPGGPTHQEKINELGEQIDVVFDTSNRLTGQLAYDIAATSQRAFEECFLEIARPFMEEYKDLPVCITGGCGLNIILNTRLVTEFKKDVFVGPNPNDCGLAVGLLAAHLQPTEQWDVTYSGLPILDKYLFDYYFNSTQLSHWWKDHLDISDVVEDLSDGKIVGVLRGRSEHGPRALGNRSIICNPMIPEMKDVLNSKVKHREWYRPFAPIVRLEDVNTYFEWEKESRWMSFAPKVREEWKEVLPSITHVDGTARVQTVTKEQNPFIYELLTQFKEKTGVGVLLNTSFNINGMPILTTLHDALYVYHTSQMDTLIVENSYIRKFMKL